MDKNSLTHIISLHALLSRKLDHLEAICNELPSDKADVARCKRRYSAFYSVAEEMAHFMDDIKKRGEFILFESLARAGPQMGELNYSLAAARLVLLREVGRRAAHSPPASSRTRSNGHDQVTHADIIGVKEMSSAFEDLDSYRTVVVTAFWNLRGRFMVYQVPRRSDTLLLSDTWHFSNNIDYFQALFYINPFHINVHLRRADQLLQLHTNEEWLNQMQTSMFQIGRRWAEVKLAEDGVSVSALGRVQLECLQNIQTGLSQDLINGDVTGAAKVFQVAADDAVKRPDAARFEQVLEVNGTIQNAIRRAQGQKFSIAFCGMVKAG